jgi:methionyl-tRNA synthetase
MYVWVDALTNYLTGLGYPDDMGEFWPASLHLIGKDIVRFHTIYWPAFLMSAGLPVPQKVFGHGFLLNRGQKESKSLGNVTDPLALAETFGVDALRYFLMREVAFGQDGSYSPEAIVQRANGELGNAFGNLAQRTLGFIAKNLDGYLPRSAGTCRGRHRAVRCGRPRDCHEIPRSFRKPCAAARRSRRGFRRCSPATPISTRGALDPAQDRS